MFNVNLLILCYTKHGKYNIESDCIYSSMSFWFLSIYSSNDTCNIFDVISINDDKIIFGVTHYTVSSLSCFSDKCKQQIMQNCFFFPSCSYVPIIMRQCIYSGTVSQGYFQFYKFYKIGIKEMEMEMDLFTKREKIEDSQRGP